MDIGVVRAVRLWFSPLGGEFPIEIKLKENDTKLGFAISRTEEVGNCFWLLHFSKQCIMGDSYLSFSYDNEG